MTTQETVEYFKEMVKGKGSYELCPCGTDDMEMTKIALAALEKQIPKKPSLEETQFKVFGIKRGICPNCGFSKIFSSCNKYCHECGQALDWGDTK